MFEKLYPYQYVHSVFDIDYEKIHEKGYRGIIFDIDNTLVHHGEDATKEIEELFCFLHDIGLKTLLLSNNNEERVKRFLKNMDSLYICNANKPEIANYLKAVQLMHIERKEAIVIGDQIFTDIYGANRSGIDSILVDFIRIPGETKIGKKRKLENVILKFYNWNKFCRNRIGDIKKKRGRKSMLWNKKRLFCDMNPVFYAISQQKEIIKRHIQNFLKREQTAKIIEKKKLPNIVSSSNAYMIKKGKGIDPVLQKNKVINIELACKKINGIMIFPKEEFSFWKTVGKTTKRKGYKDGRIIIRGRIKSGRGGGLCNLGNTIHRLILHSPLSVTEFHSHSDALALDGEKRVPFSSGTSVSYNYIDYRFKNNTNQAFQILVWCENDNLHAELRSEKELPFSYRLVEENHHFKKENDKYYRISKIYKETVDKISGDMVSRKCVLDNHSEVMYDYDLIPKDLIKE